ncbi:hypothetical protein DZ860_14925 [Vibrio sinensis]|uniref:DUF1353 domain-containing protein n=1 Tax=Vibrio sinensis TaxID=2302434 RepID=A0A3A6QCM3_9VIBR|nr:hypothetical protein [Vibrio sinensis]RJX69479.1 hypothetical protein DZ860_14925 [Vibrio sinensis]
MDDWPQPRKIVRKGNFPYKFKIETDYEYQTHWRLEKAFVSQWLDISTDGLITVKAGEHGYRWDGCTPKVSVLNLWILGVPDGHINYRTMKPYTYYASLVHDALYQYLDTVPVSKADIDLLFLEMLGDFKLKKIYYFFVCKCGGRNVVQTGT